MKNEKFNKLKPYIVKILKEKLDKTLYYHGIHHTLDDVLPNSERIAKNEGINDEMYIIMTGALLHDIGYIESYFEHEKAGAFFAEKYLPDFNYKKSEIEVIKNIILATKIPQSPKTIFEEIVCDSDLDYLGRDDFFVLSEKLRKELEHQGKKFSQEEWLSYEIEFLQKHEYFTKTEINLRNNKKIYNIKKLKNLYQKLISTHN